MQYAPCMWKALPVLICWLPLVCSAEVYKWVDADGVVHYSDEPSPSAQRFQPPEISVYPFRVPVKAGATGTGQASKPEPEAQPGESAEPETGDHATETSSYQEFRILLPANNARFSSAAGSVEVKIGIAPALGQDHVIHLLLDGRDVKSDLRSARTTLDGVPPGSHVLEARIADAAGRDLKRAKSILFHVD